MIIPPTRIAAIILFSLTGLALIGIGIWFFMSSIRKKTPPASPTQNETSATLPGTTSKEPPSSNAETKKTESSLFLSEEKETEIEILLTIERFVPTYGSYSGSSNFGNYEVLFPFMTDALRKRAQREIDTARARQQPSDTILSITTDVGKMKKLHRTPDGKEAEVVVSTFRKEYAGANSYRMFNQDIRLLLKEDAGSWLVDEIGWLPAQKN